MTATHRPWSAGGWRGWIDPSTGLDPGACLASALAAPGRQSRHARTARLETAEGVVFVKTYEAPGGWRAFRAFHMGRALETGGFGAPVVVAVAGRGQAGLLVTRDVGGEGVLAAITAGAGGWRAKRALLRRLGLEVARLHAAGFVHGDLVPANVHVVGERFVFLDNDRTRRSRLLVRFAGRRNLVQLGRFVVPGLTLADRARVLGAYGAERGLSGRARRRLAWWVVRKVSGRRAAIDRIPSAAIAHAGFRELMRSGGPFDPSRAMGGAA
jgi:Lipopolysaccharide kinase (Kdo/WaaP) family